MKLENVMHRISKAYTVRVLELGTRKLLGERRQWADPEGHIHEVHIPNEIKNYNVESFRPIRVKNEFGDMENAIEVIAYMPAISEK